MMDLPNNYVLASPDLVAPTSSSYWVVPHLLVAGAYPGAKSPVELRIKVQSLIDAGVRLFLNLMEEDEKNYAGEPFVPYAEAVRECCPDASCQRYPIQNLSVPSSAEMEEILTAIDDSLEAEHPVYVHCWGGVGRTGTVIGCWLLQHGLADPKNVLATLMKLRRQDHERGQRMSPETAGQQRFVKQWKDR